MLFATAGTSFYIGGARPYWRARQVVDGDFTGEAWIELNGLSSLGRASGEWGVTDETYPDRAYPGDAIMVTVSKTFRPDVTMEVVAGLIEDDPGQLAMLEAEYSLDAFAFRMALSNGAERRFVALVMAADHVFDEANSALCLAFALRLQSNMLRD